ncbi:MULTISPECIES: hypothetical protein [Haloarcula]|uniref:hypothetical protein n=1 Tax=Haloarcula TaxID=2237 RepID=UPI0023EB05DB|nr:hypothetical protein [Halomicroarcula sp. XH51]
MFDSRLFDRILQFMSGHEGEIISSARIDHELTSRNDESEADSQEIIGAVQDLIMLGELTLVNIQQHARVIYTPSINPQKHAEEQTDDLVWQAYIAEGDRKRHLPGLFTTKAAAEDFLNAGSGGVADELTPVDALNCVFATQIGGFEGFGVQTAVLRCQPVWQTLEFGYQRPADDEDDTLEISDETRLLVYHQIEDAITDTNALPDLLVKSGDAVDKMAVANLATELLSTLDEISVNGEFDKTPAVRRELRKGIKTQLYKSDVEFTASQRDRITNDLIEFSWNYW